MVHLEVAHATSRLSITLFDRAGCDCLTGTLWTRGASRQCSTAKRLSSYLCLPCQACPYVATSASGSSSFSCLGRPRLAQAENVLLVTWDLDKLMHGGLPSHLPAASSAWLSWVRRSNLMVGNGRMRVLLGSHVALSHPLLSLCLPAIDFFLAANLETRMFMWLQWWVCNSSPVAGSQALCCTYAHTHIHIGLSGSLCKPKVTPISDSQTPGVSLVSSPWPIVSLVAVSQNPLSYTHSHRTDVPLGNAHTRKHTLVSPVAGTPDTWALWPIAWLQLLQAHPYMHAHTQRTESPSLRKDVRNTVLLEDCGDQAWGMTKQAYWAAACLHVTGSFYPLISVFFHTCSFASKLHPPVLAFGLYP